MFPVLFDYDADIDYVNTAVESEISPPRLDPPRVYQQSRHDRKRRANDERPDVKRRNVDDRRDDGNSRGADYDRNRADYDRRRDERPLRSTEGNRDAPSVGMKRIQVDLSCIWISSTEGITKELFQFQTDPVRLTTFLACKLTSVEPQDTIMPGYAL